MMFFNPERAPRFSILVQIGINVCMFGQAPDRPPELPPVDSGVSLRLQGRVEASGTNQPLAGVRVTLGDSQTTTDQRGEFSFPNLAPGSYSIRAEAAGYLAAGKRIVILPFMVPEPVVIRVSKAATIEGVVEDPDGNPLAGAAVGLVHFLTPTAVTVVGPLATTDPEGRFRIENIAAGSYYLRASATTPSVNGQRPTQPLQRLRDVYYPRAADFGGAAAISVISGATIPGLRLRLLPPEGYRISGRVAGASGRQDLMVQLNETIAPGSAAQMDFNILLNKTPKGSVDADGTFAIDGVPPGYYNADVVAGISPLTKLPVVVTDRDLEGVILSATPGERLTGRIVDPAARLRAGTTLYLEGANREGKVFLTYSSETGEFSFNDVTPGRYRFGLMASSGVAVNKVEIAGRSAEGRVFEVHAPASEHLTVTLGAGSTISGSLEGLIAAGSPTAATATATSTPIDAVLGVGQVHSSAVSTDGTFSFKNMSPGRYRVCAWREEKPELRPLLESPSHQRQLDQVCSTVTLPIDGAAQVRVRPISISEFR
jgi:hypothetical protein